MNKEILILQKVKKRTIPYYEVKNTEEGFYHIPVIKQHMVVTIIKFPKIFITHFYFKKINLIIKRDIVKTISLFY